MDILKDILIVGGYGRAGTCIADLLMQYSNHAVTLAGRDQTKAQKTANHLNRRYQSEQCDGIKFDITNIENSQKVLELFDILIVCIPFSKKRSSIVECIVEANVHYIDITPDKTKNLLFQSYQQKFVSNGKVCLLEAGWEPGLPAILVRLADEKLGGQARDVNIHAVYRDRGMSHESIADIVEHAKFDQQIFKNNKWQKTSMLKATVMALPEPWGCMIGYPTELDELQRLPKKLDLDSLKFYQGGHNWLSDIILFLLTVFDSERGSFVFKKGVKLFHWANLKFTSPTSAGFIKVIASNENVWMTVTASNMDLYKATAIPVVASVLLLDEKEVKKGVGYMGHKLPPQKMINLLSKMGITISIKKG